MKKYLKRAAQSVSDLASKAGSVAGSAFGGVKDAAGKTAGKAGAVASIVVSPAVKLYGFAGEVSERQLVFAAGFALEYFDVFDGDKDGFVGAGDLIRMGTDWMGLPQRLAIAVLLYAVKHVGSMTGTSKLGDIGFTRESLRAYIDARNARPEDIDPAQEQADATLTRFMAKTGILSAGLVKDDKGAYVIQVLVMVEPPADLPSEFEGLAVQVRIVPPPPESPAEPAVGPAPDSKPPQG